MTTPADVLPNCRRKSMLALAMGLACVALAWAGQGAGWPIPPRLLGVLAGVGVGSLFSALLLWFMPDTSDAVPTVLRRQYYRDVLPALVAYFGVMLVWKRLLDAVALPALRLLVALLPALLVLWIMRGFVRYVRASDELQRRIELESVASAALLVSAAYMGAGFLQSAGFIDIPAKVAMLLVFPLLCFTYGMAKVFVARHYL